MRAYLNAAYAFIIVISAAAYAATSEAVVNAYNATVRVSQAACSSGAAHIASTVNTFGQWLTRISA